MLHYNALYYVMLRCAVLCYAQLFFYHIIPCYVRLHRFTSHVTVSHHLMLRTLQTEVALLKKCILLLLIVMLIIFRIQVIQMNRCDKGNIYILINILIYTVMDWGKHSF